ncbi:hypothetical protein [Asticcacaulis machinosus]|uniref:Uncharacterized protein n=1 Tax=Asticcacaulis machinosus TaxID=2984211 RepID=A0ABT5HGM4_9CAUL|nr:hypothetical protein [Asticcacaulis machinosus]MDC7675406.1 hypothetical protein [Asticcacaulis machinosus]
MTKSLSDQGGIAVHFTEDAPCGRAYDWRLYWSPAEVVELITDRLNRPRHALEFRTVPLGDGDGIEVRARPEGKTVPVYMALIWGDITFRDLIAVGHHRKTA